MVTNIPIPPEERGMAVMTHLSGLAGYIIPLCGVIVPIIIWTVKKEVPVISGIARQAVFLNIAIFFATVVSAILWITILLIPAVILFWIFLFVVGVGVPIYGALKANDGIYYRYPVVGSNP